MEETERKEVLTAEKAKAEDLFQELLEVIEDTFIATYEVEKCALVMRIPNGQRFRVSVQEIE